MTTSLGMGVMIYALPACYNACLAALPEPIAVTLVCHTLPASELPKSFTDCRDMSLLEMEERDEFRRNDLMSSKSIPVGQATFSARLGPVQRMQLCRYRWPTFLSANSENQSLQAQRLT